MIGNTCTQGGKTNKNQFDIYSSIFFVSYLLHTITSNMTKSLGFFFNMGKSLNKTPQILSDTIKNLCRTPDATQYKHD